MRDNEIPYIPIIGLTAHIAQTEVEECYKSGM